MGVFPLLGVTVYILLLQSPYTQRCLFVLFERGVAYSGNSPSCITRLTNSRLLLVIQPVHSLRVAVVHDHRYFWQGPQVPGEPLACQTWVKGF